MGASPCWLGPEKNFKMHEWEEETEDEDSDVLDVAKRIKEGSRKSERKGNLKQIQPFGFQIPSTQIDFVHTANEMV
jgi:hypothetical protein